MNSVIMVAFKIISKNVEVMFANEVYSWHKNSEHIGRKSSQILMVLKKMLQHCFDIKKSALFYSASYFEFVSTNGYGMSLGLTSIVC